MASASQAQHRHCSFDESYDFTGRLLYQLPKMSLQTGENSLELSNLDLLLSNNFYILAVQTAEGVETHRFNIP